MKLEVPKSFKDVAVEFSRAEWRMLSNREKALHREVMIQNFENMISVGYVIPLEHLCMLIKEDDTAPPGVAERDATVQQRQLIDDGVSSK
ncbi:putative postmeiotic segregation increased 2-like protein 3 [Protopterus annectens]|uniref:putative postmeiotic segregation increased 2-like protein 3 n=1 Tax=Protopterus annectens TaxID=7888 RepID=UPI001CFA6EA3|nr:putative postmeiotic segregation increased 2-like protein 3 [Protopterus annectens]